MQGGNGKYKIKVSSFLIYSLVSVEWFVFACRSHKNRS